MGTLRGGGGQNRCHHLGRKLIRRRFDLPARVGTLGLQGGLRGLNPLLRRQPSRSQGAFPLRVQPLDLLFAGPEDVSSRRTQFGVVFLGSNIGLTDRKPGFFHRSLGPLPPLGAGLHQAVVKEIAIRQNQQNKKDRGRYGTEHKITKLMQHFIHELAGGGSRID